MSRGSSNGNVNAIHDISSSNSDALVDDDFVVLEILSRLPVKSLLKFKSVCKRWRSSIQHDPYFHQLHYNHSKVNRLGFYIVTEICRDDDDNYNNNPAAVPRYASVTYAICKPPMVGHQEYFFSATAKRGTATLDTFLERKNLFYNKILGPVKGLVCLVKLSNDAVCIYNPSTREETQWIQTTIKRSRRDCILKRRFVFGFDPVSKKHKAFCHRILRSGRYAYEVLTVGDKSWRRIKPDQLVPRCNLDEPCIHVNGAIYWMNKTYHRHKADVLVAFDLRTDKFRLIPIPDFVIDQPRELDDWLGATIGLLELDGRVALVHRRNRNRNTVSMWILLFDDDDDNHRKNWTEVIITIPFNWAVGETNPVRFYNVPGTTDQIILVAYVGEVFSAYYYNWKKNAFEKEVDISGIPSPTGYSLFTPFAESLFPVNYE